MKFGTGYLDHVLCADKLQTRAKIVSRNLLRLKKVLSYDAIAFRGYSGAGMAFPVSYVTGLPLLLVRKTTVDNKINDSSHGYVLHGDERKDITKYIILDDIIASGNTVRDIIRTVERRTFHPELPSRVECVGVCLYSIEASSNRHSIDGLRVFDVGTPGVRYTTPGSRPLRRPRIKNG